MAGLETYISETIVDYLLKQGYKTYRCTIDKSGDLNLSPCAINTTYLVANFNVMQSGGLDIRFIKGYSVFTFGLNEYKEPPTLINPRLNYNQRDAVFNSIMESTLLKDLFESLYSRSVMTQSHWIKAINRIS